MKQQIKWIAVLLAGAQGFVPGMAHAQDEAYVTLSAGYEYSTGKYGTDATTEIVTIPVTAEYETGPWVLRLIVPYLRITGEGDVVVSGGFRGGRGSTSTVSQTSTTRSGLGDVVTMLSYNLYADDATASGLDLAGRVKFGTASQTMGTGENDYAVQLSAYRDVGNFTPGIMLGYEMLGSTELLPLDNVYYGSAWLGYIFSEQADAGLEYKYVQRASATAAEQRQLTFYANYRIADDVYLRGYLQKGYADGSPDTGYGVSIASVF
ncbi:MAG: hypothetical protein Q7U91_00875 [Sideroxyarcus sp.]|nr:hypothetical protein [Sideroxyarcus sp.]